MTTTAKALRINIFLLVLGIAFSVHAQNTPNHVVRIGASEIRIYYEGNFSALTPNQVHAWIEKSAQTVAQYYGVFPLSETDVYLTIAEGRGGVLHGQAVNSPNTRINIQIGQESELADLKRDWIMVHEIVHLAFAEVQERHHWIEEGLAVYVESVARVKTGELTPEFVWREFINRMPRGMPQAGDQGLDNTPTWGRIYWGGAFYCLLADIEIHKQTHNQYGLRDALQAIVRAGYTMNLTLPITTLLATGDQITGKTVLQDLYDEMKDKPVQPDLKKLWQELGIILNGDDLTFDDSAPLAPIRKAIMAPY